MIILREMDELIIKQIIDGLPIAAFVVDTNLKVLAINSRAADLVHIDVADAEGKRCYDLFHSNLCQSDCPLKRAYNQGRTVEDIEVELIDSSGFDVPAVVSATVLYDRDLRVSGGLVTLQDLRLQREISRRLEKKFEFQEMISQDPQMHELFSLIHRVAPTDARVLIQGESGTGKELIAKAIHNLSKYKDGPFVALNCAAIPQSLIESELFGYKKGAFTDARQDKKGLIEAAGGGTLFLDEVGELPMNVQGKLLRVLQEGEYMPLGALKPKKVGCRIIAATNRDLEEMVRQGEFREDLYFRLNVISITVPPLRERRGDIPLLIEEFIRRFNILHNTRVTGLSKGALRLLMEYDFPGNVRELENIIEHACILAQEGDIQVQHLPVRVQKAFEKKNDSPVVLSEAKEIEKALQINGYNREETAKYLGISRTTLWRKMKKYGLLHNGTKIANKD